MYLCISLALAVITVELARQIVTHYLTAARENRAFHSHAAMLRVIDRTREGSK